MKVGAEPKKVAILAVLLVVAVVVFFMNMTGSPEETSYTPPPAPASSSEATTPGGTADAPPTAARLARGRAGTEFRPSLRPRRGEQRPDPSTIDPTLRLDLLAKLQAVNVEGARRSLFDFSAAPPPKPDPKAAEAKPEVPNPIVPVKPDNEEVAKADGKPAAPPIPLKFYGYVSPAGQTPRRAFFTEGEDIHVVLEGELVKKRYKVVRIGVNSVVVEDTQFGSQQTLPIEEQQG
jgi:hypothetical protein